jgi:hypothetical protein
MTASEHQHEHEDQGTGGVGVVKAARRRILAGVGASALLTSVGLFGRPSAASAAVRPLQPLCCNLAHYPANTSYAYCHAHAAYIWYCSVNGFLHCSCCETAGNQLSAADCHYN